jgi:hypothetical protein
METATRAIQTIEARVETGLQSGIDKAIDILKKYNIMPKPEENQIADILEKIREVDEPKVLALANILQYGGAFSELVTNKIQDERSAHRYEKILKIFDSIVEDADKLIAQYDDKRLTFMEKAKKRWMRFRRGTFHDRFEKFKSTYMDVQRDVKPQVLAEEEVIAAYHDYRIEHKKGAILSAQLVKSEEVRVSEKRKAFADIKVDEAADLEARARTDVELAQAKRNLEIEEQNQNRINKINLMMTAGGTVADNVYARITEINKRKTDLYETAIIDFCTQREIIAGLDFALMALSGLSEATKVHKEYREGMDRALRVLGKVDGQLSQEATVEANRSFYSPETMKELWSSFVTNYRNTRRLMKETQEQAKKDVLEIVKARDDAVTEIRNILLEEQQYAKATA